MIKDGRVWYANTASGDNMCIIPKMANRHGLIAGATGTGKTVTVKVLAESFSDMGVPVFISDVKGDVTGIMMAGSESEDMKDRIAQFGLSGAGFELKGCPVSQWDIYGKNGIQLRTTISEMGPLLLARVLGLNDLQTGVLTVVFKIADDNGLLLADTKDLKAILNYVGDNADSFAADYGKIAKATIGVIVRAVVAMESEGAEVFFGEPALNIMDWFSVEGGRGIINILDSSSLINNTRLYSTFLLWLMSELFERLPEVGDMDKPKFIFFFDEAHLLFKDAPRVLMEKIEQMVKLIRSKGVGVYFCTQNPKDIPDGVLAQLGNRIEHGLRAYTPADQKAVRAAASAFRENPDMDTYDTILNLGTGEAVVSCLGDDGVPGVAQKVFILPPQCALGAASQEEIENAVKGSLYYSKYANSYDPDSAYEFLQRRDIDAVAAHDLVKKQELEDKQAAKDAEKAEKNAIKEAEREEKEKQKALEKEQKEKEREESKKKNEIKREVRQVSSTLGRTIGRSVGGQYGTIGRQIGSGVGASLGRGLFDTLFKK